MRAALSEELRGAIAELERTPAKPKAIHRCRVRLKRARALARVGRAGAPGLSAVFNNSARGLMRALAQAREYVALSDTARRLAKRTGKKGAAALNEAALGLDAARAALAPLNHEAIRAGLKDLLAIAQVWPEPSSRQIRKGAERIKRRARRARRRCAGAAAAPLRHEWRKREKDRLYAATLLGEAWPGKRRRKLSETLGEVLGRERDAILLMERLETEPALTGEHEAAPAMRVLRRARKKLSARADVIGARLHLGGA